MKAWLSEFRARAYIRMNPVRNTRPRVHYRHFEHFDRCVIGGGANSVVDRKMEYVSGVRAEMRSFNGAAASIIADAFCDFRFDGSSPDSGSYDLVVLNEGNARAEPTVSLETDSLCLGELRLGTA